jgi:hypothetical protein
MLSVDLNHYAIEVVNTYELILTYMCSVAIYHWHGSEVVQVTLEAPS